MLLAELTSSGPISLAGDTECRGRRAHCRTTSAGATVAASRPRFEPVWSGIPTPRTLASPQDRTHNRLAAASLSPGYVMTTPTINPGYRTHADQS